MIMQWGSHACFPPEEQSSNQYRLWPVTSKLCDSSLVELKVLEFSSVQECCFCDICMFSLKSSYYLTNSRNTLLHPDTFCRCMLTLTPWVEVHVTNTHSNNTHTHLGIPMLNQHKPPLLVLHVNKACVCRITKCDQLNRQSDAYVNILLSCVCACWGVYFQVSIGLSQHTGN